MMAKCVAPGHTVIKDENSVLQSRKAVLDGKKKNCKTTGKKDGSGFARRKALNDITNKKSHQPEAFSRKKNLPKEEFNVKEEMFLHDHKKCIEAQKAAMSPFNFDLIFPKDDSVSIFEHCQQTKVDLDSSRCYIEPAEVPMSEFSVWLDSSIQWSSPPSSPLRWNCPCFPFAWQDEEVNFVLKEEIEARM